MAALIFDVPCGASVALTANTVQTVLGVKSPGANVPLRILEASVSFDGATSSNAPALVEFCTCTFATVSPGTNSTSVTPVKRNQSMSETVQSTSAKTWTVEPTVVTPFRQLLIPQYDGVYHYINPKDLPYIIKGGTGFTIRITSPNNVNFNGHITAEE
jgi:hypothetical protein